MLAFKAAQNRKLKSQHNPIIAAPYRDMAAMNNGVVVRFCDRILKPKNHNRVCFLFNYPYPRSCLACQVDFINYYYFNEIVVSIHVYLVILYSILSKFAKEIDFERGWDAQHPRQFLIKSKKCTSPFS